jgi:hypothetical protein
MHRVLLSPLLCIVQAESTRPRSIYYDSLAAADEAVMLSPYVAAGFRKRAAAFVWLPAICLVRWYIFVCALVKALRLTAILKISAVSCTQNSSKHSDFTKYMYINVSHQKKTMIYAQKERKRTSPLCSFCTRKEDTAVGVMTMRATMHKAIVLLLQNAMTRWYR